ncbi:hypothetical protein ON010_g10880 [Phytophthora cinnamomi]|nr:hypothetical protein ON010_g10880 [Phytophthora cinnamomi]
MRLSTNREGTASGCEERRRGKPARGARAVFAEADPATSIPASRTLHSPEYVIFIARAKRTAGAPNGQVFLWLPAICCADQVLSPRNALRALTEEVSLGQIGRLSKGVSTRQGPKRAPFGDATHA